MKFLIDTCIVIPLEPTSSANVAVLTEKAVEFDQIVRKAKHELYLHPEQVHDIERDKDNTRREYRKLLSDKYLKLPSPPSITKDLKSIIGSPPERSNDWVDNHLLVALYRNAVDYLVTEDKKIHSKGRRLGIEERILTLPDAVNIVGVLFDDPPSPPSPVRAQKVHNLEQSDPIFEYLRERHEDFDSIFIGWSKAHLDTMSILGSESNLAAVTVFSEDESNQLGFQGKALRIYCLRVSELYSEYYYGELLLKALLSHSKSLECDWIYAIYDLEEQYLSSLNWLHTDFGFEIHSKRTNEGSHILLKKLTPSPEEKDLFNPVEYFRRFGPMCFKIDGIPHFIVPIKAIYHRYLFPDAEPQEELHTGFHPFGNSIRKAYLSRAPIRNISPGDVLLFYKSDSARCVTTVGVVENSLVSHDPNEVAKFVGRRTVLSFSEIAKLCERDILVLLFQHAGSFHQPIPYESLLKKHILKGPPQSIQSVPKESLKWLQDQMTDGLQY